MNLCELIAPPLQGRGRWFKSSIAHLEKVAFCRHYVLALQATLVSRSPLPHSVGTLYLY
jgi:hypothetical protein